MAQGGAGQAQGGAGAGGKCVTSINYPSVASQDGVIISGACGSIAFATFPFANISDPLVSRGVLVFEIPSEAINAIHNTPQAVTMSLTLTRAPACDANGMPCPAHGGHLSAFPMRTDWDDENVRWCGPKDNEPWGAPGASLAGVDVGEMCGGVDFSNSDHTVTIPLDPAMFVSWSASGRVGVELRPGPAAVFVMATRENVSGLAPPRLDVGILSCP